MLLNAVDHRNIYEELLVPLINEIAGHRKSVRSDANLRELGLYAPDQTEALKNALTEAVISYIERVRWFNFSREKTLGKMRG